MLRVESPRSGPIVTTQEGRSEPGFRGTGDLDAGQPEAAWLTGLRATDRRSGEQGKAASETGKKGDKQASRGVNLLRRNGGPLARVPVLHLPGWKRTFGDGAGGRWEAT